MQQRLRRAARGVTFSVTHKVPLLAVFAVVAACGGGGGGGSTTAVNNPPPTTDTPPPEPELPVTDPSLTGPLSSTQVGHLTLLGKVWGFLKYHHPRITSGQLDWDRELITVLPAVLAAGDATASHDAVLGWLQETLGEPAACSICASDPTDYYFLADLDWIRDESLLGAPLSAYLQRVYQNRSTSFSQFYVALGAGAKNARFVNEGSYSQMTLPNGGYRLLALFRLWNIVQYFFPYRDIIGEPWNNVLGSSIDDYYDAQTRGDYVRALLRTFARINDTHANLWNGGGTVLPPQGACRLPLGIRFIEDSATVVAYTHDEFGPASGLEIGDILLTMDGRTIQSLIDEWRPYYPASNEPTRLRDIARFIARGDCAPVDLEIRRGTDTRQQIVDRIPSDQVDTTFATHDLPGDTFQLLAPDVAYLKLSSVLQADSAQYVADAEGTDGLIIDIRNYPNEFVVFSLGQHLVSSPTSFATFTVPDLSNPGAFVWETFIPTLQPQQPFYGGKVAILVDEVTQSQAEYTTMAFRTAPDSIVIGSTTAGADGNVSSIPLPGGVGGAISGIGVFYPDRITATQRIGIIPDVVVEPTVAGIAEGRDELLDYAIGWIRGTEPVAAGGD